MISSLRYPQSRAAAGFQLVITPSRAFPITASWEDWMIDASRAVASAASRRSVLSLTAAVMRVPWSVWMADSEISAGNVLPSLRRPARSMPAPIGRGRGLAR